MPRIEERNAEVRARRVEEKRSQGAMSCAECRRLKLKCSKTIPCTTCVRRGCESICPNGQLLSGQGTRLILADTEQLHDKITQMSDRIQQLQEALELLRTQESESLDDRPTRDDNDRPTRDDNDDIKHDEIPAIISPQECTPPSSTSEPQLVGAVEPLEHGHDTLDPKAFGSGLATPAPSSASPEPTAQPSLLDEVIALYLPHPSPVLVKQKYDTLMSYLPPWTRACQLRDLFLQYRHWGLPSVTYHQLCDELLPLFYAGTATGPSYGASVTSEDAAPDSDTADQLAIVFIIFALASLVDLTLPAAPQNQDGTRYFELTLETLTNIAKLLDHAPSFWTIQLLILIGHYRVMANDFRSVESMPAYIGFAGKLSQIIGFPRDPARWNLTPERADHLRFLFWELVHTDHWISLAHGRHPTFLPPGIQCQVPSSDHFLIHEPNCHPDVVMWKVRFTAEVLMPLSALMINPASAYEDIVSFDGMIRARPLPHCALGILPPGANLMTTMSYLIPKSYLEYALLYLHRSYFAQSLYDSPHDPVHARHSFSFSRGFETARAMLGLLRQEMALFPAECARMFFFWTHGFSAMVLLASAAILGPRSTIAPAALFELGQGLDSFERAAIYGGRTAEFIPVLQGLHAMASQKVHGTAPARDRAVSISATAPHWPTSRPAPTLVLPPPAPAPAPLPFALPGPSAPRSHRDLHDDLYLQPPRARAWHDTVISSAQHYRQGPYIFESSVPALLGLHGAGDVRVLPPVPVPAPPPFAPQARRGGAAETLYGQDYSVNANVDEEMLPVDSKEQEQRVWAFIIARLELPPEAKTWLFGAA